ncbi:hypothetical protein [Saprospira grandis]|uniref:Uncharacterized protein n=1 Tax=Saprospira grandis (strain Lewin) TaxID=984262 RepID=H6L0R1_SAPGL|nr:hypothetical protein [Saprospira grandis]AFC24597.1 hypothetical protein SGRA_1863 [Saprospira grandis str. Lewin]
MRILSTLFFLLLCLSLWAQKSEKQEAFEKGQQIKSSAVQLDKSKLQSLRSAPTMQMYQQGTNQSVKAPTPLRQLQDVKQRSSEDGRPSKQEELLLLELKNQATPKE